MFDPYYVLYLAHFHGTRDFFECHEVLEERWKMEKPLDRESILVAFIQLSVALYHYRRNNFKGAKRILKKGRWKFHKHREVIEQYGLHTNTFFHLLQNLEEKINSDHPYEDIQLPIINNKLKEEVEHQCKKLGVTFPSKSDFNNNLLIHKHRLRHK